MKQILTSEKIYVSRSKMSKAGRGVFARSNIKKSELIEICPVIGISESDTSNLIESILVTYFYYFGRKKERSVVALGFGSIYNHSYSPNALYKEKYKDQVIEFWTLKEIKKGEEITVSYIQGSKKDTKPLWFTA